MSCLIDVSHITFLFPHTKAKRQHILIAFSAAQDHTFSLCLWVLSTTVFLYTTQILIVIHGTHKIMSIKLTNFCTMAQRSYNKS